MSARCLVFVSEPQRLSGLAPIAPDYPKPYTASEMRGWAADLQRIYRLSPAELQRLRATSPERLTPDEQRLRQADQRYLRDFSEGVKGDLRPDGSIELAGGRHRAAYLVEQGVGPIPVWVSCEDPQRLEAFRQASHASLDGQLLRFAGDERAAQRERIDDSFGRPRDRWPDRDPSAEERTGR